jgi:cysteine desulfurase / selenocysteine lyase
VYPWMAQQTRGVHFELVPADARGLPDEDRLLERLDRGGVAVLAVSSVQFGSGFHADLARLGQACRERGIFFVVDAIQSLGCLPLDVRTLPIDVLATGGHKWLCAPFGTGFAYVRREVQDRLEPRVVGWTAMQASRDFARLTDYRWEWVPDARRYEVATLPFEALAGLAASAELLLEVGVETVERHVTDLLDPLVGWLAEHSGIRVLSDLDPARRSAIVAFRTPDPEATHAALGRAGVVCAHREHAIRIAPHLYNTPTDIARVIDVLSSEFRR